MSALHALRGSVRLLRQRFTLMVSLGGAVVLGLTAACCGIGALIAPLFLCELLAVQLAHARGLTSDERGEPAAVASVVRHRSWLLACVVLLGAVVLTASVGWLVGLGLGTEVIEDGAAWPSPAWLLVPASALFALGFVLPFLYAPLLLIERPMPMTSALLESARLVHAAGALSQLALSCAANLVQVSPLLLGTLLAHALIGPQLGSLWALAGLPLMALTVPLGQGMVAWSFAQLSPPVAGEDERPALRGRARTAAWVWGVLLLAPLLAFGTLGASLVRPSRILEGDAPKGAEPMATLVPQAERTGVVVPRTALTVRADKRNVRIEASDGGGAGRLPLRVRAPIDRVHVSRARDRYAIVIVQGAESSVTFVDRAGVRLDDDLRARLADRVSQLDLALMLLALLLTAAVQLPLLSAAGRARHALPAGQAGELALERGANKVLALGFLLAPLSAWSLWRAFTALTGLA